MRGLKKMKVRTFTRGNVFRIRIQMHVVSGCAIITMPILDTLATFQMRKKQLAGSLI